MATIGVKGLKSRWRVHYYVIFMGVVLLIDSNINFGIDPRYRTSGIDDTSTLVSYRPGHH